MGFSYAGKIFNSLLMLIIVVGCSTLQHYRRQTSGIIGCPESEIEMTEPQNSISKSWTAKCRGQTFYCSSTQGLSIGATDQIKCAKQVD